MTNFKKTKIDSQIITIIDLGSYKIRVAICEYKKEKIKLLAFSEKRQSIGDIIGNEIKNIENVCENIQIAIKKAEKIANMEVKKIVINSTFSPTFLKTSKINYKRENKNKNIKLEELKEILETVEEKAVILHTNSIKEKFLYTKQDLEIIVNNISNINIDNENTSSLIGLKGEKLFFDITNVFISKASYETINYIGKYLNKEIIKVVPEDFSLTKLWNKEKDIVIINIGNASSYIIIKDDIGNIIGSVKLEVGIESLINRIREKSSMTRSEIIKKIDRDDFSLKEKKDFLEIYSYLIIESLKEILKDKICPNNFFIIGGGGNNSFFKNYFKKINLKNHGLKITKNIKYILPEIKKIAKIENIENILNKSNLNLISIILTYNFLLQRNQNTIEKITKKIIEKIED